MRVYRCPVCGYLHSGPPDFHFCPICSTPTERFFEAAPEQFGHWDLKTRLMLEAMAETGHYHLEGKGTTRSFLNLDEIIFLPAMVASLPLMDDDPVDSAVVLGKTAKQPVTVNTPVFISGMSFGALSKEAKMALAKGASLAGSIANSGEGGMLDEERELADHYTLQYSTGRFGAGDDRLRMADMVEIKIAQGAKPGMGGKLPAAKVTEEIAKVRGIEPFTMSQSPSRHPDVNNPKDLSEKIAWIRELTEGKPVSLKLVGGHIVKDLDAIFSQEHIPDVLVFDGGEGGTGAAPVLTKDQVGLPLAYSLPRVADYLSSNGLTDRITLIAAGGIRHPGDAAKLLALGADAVYMAGAMKIALGCKYIRQCHRGTCPVGIATQDPKLRKRLNVEEKAAKVANLILAITEDLKTLARICGKQRIQDLSKEDMVALNPELARITGVAQA